MKVVADLSQEVGQSQTLARKAPPQFQIWAHLQGRKPGLVNREAAPCVGKSWDIPKADYFHF